MAIHKLSRFSPAVSLLALTVLLPGCAATKDMFHSEPKSAEAEANANYQASLDLGDRARADGNLEEAAGHYGRAARWAPNEVWPLIQLSDVLWEAKNPTESVKVLEHARSIDAHNTAVLRNLGRAYVALNQPGKAEAAYLAALETAPEDAKILNGLGIAYDLDGDHAAAQSHYRSALAFEPNNLDIRNNLSYSLISSKKYDEAVAILKTLVDSPNATPRQRQNLALAYGLMGKDDKAREVSKVDLTPAQIEQNIEIYHNLRAEPSQPDTLRHIGRPTFATGGLSTKMPEATKAPPLPASVTEPTETVTASAPVSVQPLADAPKAEETTPNTVPGTISLTPATDKAADVKADVKAEETAKPTEAPKKEEPKKDTAKAEPKADPEHILKAPKEAAAQETSAQETPVPSNAAATTSGLGGNGKIYLGDFGSEREARESWIKVWVNNSALLGSMAASIEPNNGKMALYAVGAADSAKAGEICTSLRQNGVSCGVAK